MLLPRAGVVCVLAGAAFALGGLSADTTAVWGIGTSLSVTTQTHREGPGKFVCNMDLGVRSVNY